MAGAGKRRRLWFGLDPFTFSLQQQKATLSSDVPGDIITAAESGKRLVEFWGLKGAELNAAQQGILKSIVREFVFNLGYEKASIEYDKILKAGVQNIYFGWIGRRKEAAFLHPERPNVFNQI